MYLIIATTSCVTVLVLLRLLKHMIGSRKTKGKAVNSQTLSAEKAWDYNEIRNLIQSKNIVLPAMLVDLDLFESNVKTIQIICRRSGKKLRIATKSVRCPYLIQRISDICMDVLSGFMCYSVSEANFLYEQGHDDFFIPYPTVQPHDIELALKLASDGGKLCLTVDSIIQVLKLNAVIAEIQMNTEKPCLRVCIDLDMSYKIGWIKLGAHRSSICSIAMVSDLVSEIKNSSHLRLVGFMGYEASVAGLPDQNPHSAIPYIIMKYIKGLFYRHCVAFRGEVLRFCFKNNIDLEFFNGGGTGNIQDVCNDNAVTEVTVGSAFMQSQLFDYFEGNVCLPACCFALQCTRISQSATYITCQSGGFIACGAVSLDKCPTPFSNPYKLEAYSDEGYGEVQTPLRVVDTLKNAGKINIGDPVFFRPAKSGEIAEHFMKYFIKREYSVIDEALTYRGMGKVFY